MNNPLKGPRDPGQSLADHGAGVVHRTWRILYCFRHTTEFLDRKSEGEPGDLCPICSVEGRHHTLRELGVVALPFFETNPERPE